MIPCVFLEIRSVVLEINPLPMIATLFLSGFPGLQKDPCKNPPEKENDLEPQNDLCWQWRDGFSIFLKCEFY